MEGHSPILAGLFGLAFGAVVGHLDWTDRRERSLSVIAFTLWFVYLLSPLL